MIVVNTLYRQLHVATVVQQHVARFDVPAVSHIEHV